MYENSDERTLSISRLAVIAGLSNLKILLFVEGSREVH